MQLLLNRGSRSTREIEFLSLEQATPFDFARENMEHFSGPSRDRPNIERILKMKSDMEDEDRKVLKRHKAAMQALEDQAEADKLRKEQRAKDRADKMEEKQRLREEARNISGEDESKAKLAEVMKREAEEKAARMRAREHRAGLWAKAAKYNWNFKTGMLTGSAQKQGLIDDCLELSESMRGDEQQEKLRRRWKKITGTRLVELDKDGNEISRAQAIANSKAEAAETRASVEAMEGKAKGEGGGGATKLPQLNL